MNIKCQHCAHLSLDVPEGFLNKLVQCPSCKEQFTLLSTMKESDTQKLVRESQEMRGQLEAESEKVWDDFDDELKKSIEESLEVQKKETEAERDADLKKREWVTHRMEEMRIEEEREDASRRRRDEVRKKEEEVARVEREKARKKEEEVARVEREKARKKEEEVARVEREKEEEVARVEREKEEEIAWVEREEVLKKEAKFTGYIYFLSSLNPKYQGLCKIGLTTQLIHKRIANSSRQATYLYSGVTLEKSIKVYGLEVSDAEKLIHKKLRPYWEVQVNPDNTVAREWFRVSSDDAYVLLKGMLTERKLGLS